MGWIGKIEWFLGEKGVVQVVASMVSRNSEPVEALTKRG